MSVVECCPRWRRRAIELLLSEAWLRLIDELWPDIDISVSIDGPRHANPIRVDFHDRSTFDHTADRVVPQPPRSPHLSRQLTRRRPDTADQPCAILEAR
ncbi:hypothetical protein [Luedemannella flava]|uniref:hypothetical protein n=1 Tax=Luedemannella flava TaxID=349316 RepID=UPI0031DFF7F3